MNIIVELHALDWIIIAGYIGFMLFIGFYFHTKSQGFDDYFMAGRDLTAPLLVGTLVSTFYGLDTLFGTSEIGFYEGISAFFAYSLPYTGMYILMAFLAPVFKSKFPNGTTMQDICYNKYGKAAGIVSSLAAFIYSTNTMEMLGIGFLLSLILPIPVWLGTIIGAIIVIVYTYTGGLWAVTITDFIQFVIMMITLGIAMIIGWNAFGGYEMVYEGLTQWCGEDPWYYFSPGAGYLSTATLISYSITCLAVLAEPAFFQRVFAAASPKEIKKAFAVGVPMWLAFDWIVTFLGILGAAAIGIGLIPEVEANQALMAVVGQYLPPGLLGLFIAGVLAASMSTADSYFLVSGGVIGYDLYKKIINPSATDKKVEQITKYGILASAILSLALTFMFDKIMEIWVFQATIILSVSLIPVYFGTFMKKKPKKIAGTLATVIGFILSLIWYIWSNFFGTWSEDWEVYVIKIGHFEFWQEQGILIIIPIVVVIYLLANIFGKQTMNERGNTL